MLGLYPTWLDLSLSSGWAVAFIATIHVLFSHASVGGGILMGCLANYAARHDKPGWLDFIRRYGLFLLVFSYVLGSITGVGIWLAATIASPRGVSALIHSFVWVWATEWVFFIIEVISIYLLVYLAGRVDVRTHTRLTVIFGLSSVATLLIIVGILSFMLWPGDPAWFEKGGVVSSFFGPNTLSQVLARLAFVLAITAVVAGMVVARVGDRADRVAITRVLAAFGIVGVALGYLAFRWYLTTVPPTAADMLALRLPDCFPVLILGTTLIALAYFVLTWLRPALLSSWLAALMTAVVLIGGLAPEEFAREIIRKPWVAGQYVYANQLVGRDVPALGIRSELPLLAQKGLLATHPFLPAGTRQLTPDNRLEAGRAIALTLCGNCHSFSTLGPRPLARYLPGAKAGDIEDFLGAGLYRGLTAYMPPIPLPPEERKALAAYLESYLATTGAAK